MTSTSPLMTADELLGYELPGKRVELVRGRLLVREHLWFRHAELGTRVVFALNAYLNRDRETRNTDRTRGRLVVGGTGFTLARNPDTVRAPDAAYISRERFEGAAPQGYAEFAPDLAVELRSPTDRPGALLAKIGDWLEAGTHVVWVVDPLERQVAIYRADGSQALLEDGDVLCEDTLLPGFELPIVELFAE